ncbi:hypothetical protein D3C77_508330 [compost metagenome]
MMISNNCSIEHIDDAHQEEEALFTFDPTILLIGSGNDFVICESFRMLGLELPLRAKHIHLLAQPIDFLLVNHKVMLAP